MAESLEHRGRSRDIRSQPKASILLVDDHPANLLSVGAILEDLGQNLVEAHSGEEALERVQSDEFAVVLLDVSMPGISGFETARLIRGHERSRHTPIIFLTASDIERSQLEEAYRLGAVDYLGKPLMPIVLQAKVRGFVELFLDKQQARREADQLRLLVHGTTEYAIFMLDPEGHVITWNPGAERLKGYTAEEIIGQHFSRFYPPDALERDWPKHELEVARIEGRCEDEGWRVRKDGSQFWANVVITAHRDETGTVLGFSKITRDLTERKQSEENARDLAAAAAARRVAEENARLIQEQRERLHVTLASIGDAVITTDREGRVTFLNPVAEKLVGWKTQEAADHTLANVFRIVNEKTRQPVENPVMRALQEGMVIGLANHTVLISRDGTERPIDDSAAPIRDATGNVVGCVLVFRDITERKQSEKRLREQQEWLQVTLASIGDAVIATDTDSRVTFLNGVAQQLTGWTQEEAQSEPLETVFAILNEQTGQPVENPVGKVLRDGAIVGLGNHTVLTARDGTKRPIDDSAAPIRDAAGEMIGVVLIFRDVTEQRRADHELRASEARKRAILETALDCIITIDCQGKVVEFNPAAERTFGYSRDQVMGQELCEFIIPPLLRGRHREGMAHYLATGEGPVLGRRLELPALRADGSEFPVELAITRISTDGPPLFTAYLRDISEQQEAEQHRNLRLAVTHALSEAGTMEDGVNGVLGAVCDNLAWDVGFFWSVNDAGDRLVCRSSWHKADATVTEFETASCSRTFEQGEGLPGRVWASSKPAWILDAAHDANFPRLASAVKHGLHSGFAYPVVVGQTFGVIEFFTKSIREADADLLETMGTVAGNLSQFIERKAAENELRRSEQELSDFFENATIGLHWVGPDGTILRANQAELDMLGYSREEYVGRRIAEFHADQDVICDILNRLQAGEKLAEYPARLRCKDGSIREVLIDSSVLFKDGTFVHTRCFTRDVTERNLAEANMREQEQRTRTILETITDAFWSVDRNWRFVYLNRRAEELLSRKREDLLGKNLWEEFAPAVGTEFYHAYHRALAENVAVTVEAYYPPHDRWYEVHAYPSPEGLSVYFRDSSQRRQAEAALRESEEKLRLLADTIPQLAWMARRDGHVFWYNRRWYEYTGTTPEQMEGWGWQSVHDPNVLPKVLERWKESIATGEPFDMVFPLKRADGQFCPFLTRVNPLRDGAGRVLYWFGTNTDISEIKRMEEALRDADRRKDQFLATLAHELRNPLAPIRNSLQILKMPRVEAATAQQTRDMMERQVHHLVRLVDDLLDVSRVMRGKIELRKERIELATLVARAVETAKPLIEVQGHQLDISVAPDSLLLNVDPMRLTQVIGNLLTNAAKYTEQNGRIWLTASRVGNQAVLTVRDTGIGIAPDMLPHVFELFVQADHSSTKAQGGLGIGLTLVKNLVEIHEGTVEAHSAGLGKGSEFVVRLPLMLERKQQRDDKEEFEQNQVIPASGHRVLVVDDNHDAAISLSMLLRLQGHEVRVTHDGLSALEVATSLRPDIIFLDIGMPGMDGYEVARRVRTTPGLEKTVLAALTGWGQQEDRRRTAEAGFDHHLVKPPEPKALESILGTLQNTSRQPS